MVQQLHRHLITGISDIKSSAIKGLVITIVASFSTALARAPFVLHYYFHMPILLNLPSYVLQPKSLNKNIPQLNKHSNPTFITAIMSFTIVLEYDFPHFGQTN